MALEAVRQWRYGPTLWGNPIEVVIKVMVNYALSH
jgi:hypothetical protein